MTEQHPTIPTWSFPLFLSVIISLFFISPVLGGIGLGKFFYKGIFVALSISYVYMVSRKKGQIILAIFLAIPGIFVTLSTDSFEYSKAELLAYISNLILYLFVISVVFSYVRNQRVVDRSIIAGAVCIYLLLGLVWAFIYMIIELLSPHSFNGLYSSNVLSISSVSEVFNHLFYYSYVTLTTLGYGSISPRSIVASAFSSAEAITGQLYFAIFMARLVGLYTAQEFQPKN